MGTVAFEYWWQVRRFLMFPVVNNGAGAGLGFLGLIVALIGLLVPILGPVNWALTALGAGDAAIYFGDGAIRRIGLRHGPVFEKNIRPEDFIHAPGQLEAEYRFVHPSDETDRQLYPYTDLSQHDAHIRMENDLTRQQRAQLYMRWYRCCSAGFLHLEKRIDGQWRPIATTIMLPLSVAGAHAIVANPVSERVSIVDMDQGQIRPGLEAGRRLLVDTWVIDRRFAGAGHGKTASRGGFGNALVLRHIAAFLKPRRWLPLRDFTIIVESENPHLITMLQGFKFRQAGRSRIGEDFYELDSGTALGMLPDEARQVLLLLRTLATVPLVEGTAPPPRDWSQYFPR